jgi:hypothetical protein
VVDPEILLENQILPGRLLSATQEHIEVELQQV